MEPLFVIMGDHRYGHLLIRNAERIRHFYPEAPIHLYDWGLTSEQQRMLPARISGLTLVDWRHALATAPPIHIEDESRRLFLAKSYIARHPYFKRRFKKMVLKKFPRSALARKFIGQALGFEAMLCQKIACLRHAAAEAGPRPIVFLDADAILFEPIHELLTTDHDVTLTLVFDDDLTYEHDRCYVINSGFIQLGPDSARRSAFLEQWWQAAHDCHEWITEQTSLTRFLHRASETLLAENRRETLTLGEQPVTIQILPSRIYNFYRMDLLDSERILDAKVVHFKDRAQHKPVFNQLVAKLDQIKNTAL